MVPLNSFFPLAPKYILLCLLTSHECITKVSSPTHQLTLLMILTPSCPLFQWNSSFKFKYFFKSFYWVNYLKRFYKPLILLCRLTTNNINNYFPLHLGKYWVWDPSSQHQKYSAHRKYAKVGKLNLNYQKQWTLLCRSNVLYFMYIYQVNYKNTKLRIGITIPTPKTAKTWKKPKYLTFNIKIYEEGTLTTACKLVKTFQTDFTRTLSITAGQWY